MTHSLDPWDSALLEALQRPTGDELVTLPQLAETSGLSLPLLEALAREGLLIAESDDPEPLFNPADADAVGAGLELVGAGLPLAELLDLARAMNDAMQPIAERAVELFANYVRDSVEVSAPSTEEATAMLVDSFAAMLPATGRLVDHHFRRLLVAGARRRLTPP